MEELSTIQKLIIYLPPLLFAITLHEVAHGWAALYFGDNTAQAQGRLSLNPINHIDPLGTVIIPLLLFFTGGFIFGWAKPVPVNVYRLRHPKRDMAFVALAGPSANIIMALIWVFVMAAGLHLIELLPWVSKPLVYTGFFGIIINLMLAMLNMLPIPPLDGSKVVAGVLPNTLSQAFVRLEPVGLIILVLLLATGWLGLILHPMVDSVSTFILQVVQLTL